MRYLLILYTMSLIVFASCSKEEDTDPFKEFIISMGTNSSRDVYYSFMQGEVSSVIRADWDIAFSTPMQSATVRINEGTGVELYSVGDTNDWETFVSFNPDDFSELLNDKADWTVGAFNQNPSSVFNFGWGTYNMGDHNVNGDSIYVVKLSDESYKKLFIRRRIGITGTYLLRWANIDGSEQVDTSFSCTPYYGIKHFIHYSIVNQEVVEAEPNADEWDLLFTRYNEMIPTGPTTSIKYAVTGVLINPDVSVAKVTDMPPEMAKATDSSTGFISDADAIGYDWKVSDPITHEISLVDSVSYFIQSVDGNTYQLFFTDYGGMDQGTIAFKTRMVE